MTELVFYTNPQSCGRIVHWMLEEIGAPYAVEVKDFGTTMKAPDYLTINPMGNVGSHLGVRISNFDPKKPSNGFILNLCCNRKLGDKISH